MYGYEASTANSTSKVTAVLKAPTKASMALAVNGVTLANEASATWLSGVNYLTVNTEYGTTKLLYVVEVTKTGTSIGSLTVTSADGTETGDTKLTVAGTRLAGTSLVYTVSDTSISTPTLDDVLEGWTAWDGTSDITATHGHKIGVAEVLSNGMVKSFGQATVDSDGA